MLLRSGCELPDCWPAPTDALQELIPALRTSSPEILHTAADAADAGDSDTESKSVKRNPTVFEMPMSDGNNGAANRVERFL